MSGGATPFRHPQEIFLPSEPHETRLISSVSSRYDSAHPSENRLMDYRLLGRSGLKVSSLSIGTATFGGDGLWGATDVKDAQRQIDRVVEHAE